MEAATIFLSPQSLCKAPSFVPRSCVLAAAARGDNSVSFVAEPHLSTRWPKGCRPVSPFKQGQRRVGARRDVGVRASSFSPSESSLPIAPLQMESPAGQFLSQILVSHPHLLPAAVDHQLEQLLTDREAEKNKGEPTPSATDIVLYRRIAEVKASERRRALEEILYALVVQKFVEADVLLIPAISQSAHSSGRVDQWPSDVEKLEKLHSSEANELIKCHLALLVGQRLGDSNSAAPVIKLRVGHAYVASVLLGYFLKRVDQRFQLEKSMKTLDEEENAIEQAMPDDSRPSCPSELSHPEVSYWPSSPFFSQGGFGSGVKPCRLLSYITSFDLDSIRRCATIQSKEAFGIIGKHTKALFSWPAIVITPGGAIDCSKDELITISFAGLRRLMLEAVTFGSFLWDVESYVDSRYRFVTN